MALVDTVCHKGAGAPVLKCFCLWSPCFSWGSGCSSSTVKEVSVLPIKGCLPRKWWGLVLQAPCSHAAGSGGRLPGASERLRQGHTCPGKKAQQLPRGWLPPTWACDRVTSRGGSRDWREEPSGPEQENDYFRPNWSQVRWSLCPKCSSGQQVSNASPLSLGFLVCTPERAQL